MGPWGIGSVDRLLIMRNFTVGSCLAVWSMLCLESWGKLLLMDVLLKALYPNSFRAMCKHT